MPALELGGTGFIRTPFATCLGFNSAGTSQSHLASARFTGEPGSSRVFLLALALAPPILAQNDSRLAAALGLRFAWRALTGRLSVICAS